MSNHINDSNEIFVIILTTQSRYIKNITIHGINPLFSYIVLFFQGASKKLNDFSYYPKII